MSSSIKPLIKSDPPIKEKGGPQPPFQPASAAANATSEKTKKGGDTAEPSKKGKTESQGVQLMPLVVKWAKVAGLLLAVYLVGYFGFSLTWVLAVDIVFVVVGLYRSRGAFKKSQTPVDNQQDVHRARVDELPAWVYFPDVERVEWLNKIIQQMWPFIDEFVQNLLQTTVQKVVNENLPVKLTPFKFEKIDLGHIPLRLGGIKVYTDNVKRDEIVMDVDFTFASVSDYIVSIRGFKGGVRDVTVQGTVRVVLRPLVNQIPIVGGFSVFFLSQPNIDFDLTEFAKVLDVPLLSTCLRTIVSDVIANLLVMPNKITIPLIKNLKAGQLQFLLPQGIVHLNVIEAKDLKRMDFGLIHKGKSDPYCKIMIGGQMYQTDVIKNDINPYWNKSFEVVIESSVSQVINIEVMDKDDPVKEDDALGSTFLNVDEIRDTGVVDKWLELENVNTGELHLKASWLYLSTDPAELNKAKLLKSRNLMDSIAVLVVFIDSAKDLPRSKKQSVEPNSFVRLELGNRTETTEVKHRTVQPRWEQTYYFLVTDPELQELSVEVLDNAKADKRIGLRKVPLYKLLSNDDMAMTRPFPLKDADSECSIAMSLALRILTHEKPSADDDNSPTDGSTDAAAKNAEEGSFKEREQLTSEMSVSSPSPMDSEVVAVPLVGSSGDRRSSSIVSGQFEPHPDAGQLRYRGDHNVVSGGSFGRIKITMRYSSQRSHLVVVVHQCTNLIDFDSDHHHHHRQMPDPYVRLYLLPDRSSSGKKKTQTVKDDLNPVFDETVEWSVTKKEASTRTLELMVKNSVSVFSKDRVNMGVLRLDLSAYEDLSTPVSDWFDLQDPGNE